MESNEQNKLTNKIETLITTENRMIPVGGRVGGLGERSEEIKQKQKTPLIDTIVWCGEYHREKGRG